MVALADGIGSTSYIVEYCKNTPPSAVTAIGTEINLINRMAHAYPDKKIFELSGQICRVCANMYHTTLNDLCYTLENLKDIKPITVLDLTRRDTALALEKMLEIS